MHVDVDRKSYTLLFLSLLNPFYCFQKISGENSVTKVIEAILDTIHYPNLPLYLVESCRIQNIISIRYYDQACERRKEKEKKESGNSRISIKHHNEHTEPIKMNQFAPP